MVKRMLFSAVLVGALLWGTAGVSHALGRGGALLVPGKGGAFARKGTVTGRQGGTASGQGAGAFIRGKGGAAAGSGSWSGQRSTGTASGAAAWKKGSGGQSQSNVQVTSKKTGQTYGETGSTTYNKITGGSTTIETASGKTYTKTYPPR